MSPNPNSQTEFVCVKIQRLSHGEDMPLPEYQSAHAAGFDLLAAVPTDQPVKLRQGERALIPTGLAMALPAGYEGQVRPRSGLAHKSGITVLNTPGTIDADYRGEVKVILINFGEEVFEVTRGMRIAQLVVQPVTRADLEVTSELSVTERGAGGFGSTGTDSK